MKHAGVFLWSIAAEADEIWDVIEKQVKEEKEKKQSENAVNRFTKEVASVNKFTQAIQPKQPERTTRKLAEKFNTNHVYVSDAKKLRTENPGFFIGPPYLNI